jgi:hypothetical protein
MTKQEWQAQLRLAEKGHGEITDEWHRTFKKKSKENEQRREELLPKLKEVNERIALIEKKIKSM